MKTYKWTRGSDEPQLDLSLSAENGEMNTRESRDGKQVAEDGKRKQSEGFKTEGYSCGRNDDANGQGDLEKATEDPKMSFTIADSFYVWERF